MNRKKVILAVTALASALVFGSCTIHPLDSPHVGDTPASGKGGGVRVSRQWQEATYDSSGFPIYGYSYGRPVYGYTSSGVAIYNYSGIGAACYVPSWGPASWYVGGWHYPHHVHRAHRPYGHPGHHGGHHGRHHRR